MGMPGTFYAPYPQCLHCDVRAAQQKPYQLAPYISPEVYDVTAAPARTCCNSPLRALEQLFEQQTSPTETAAIVVEPILGEGGILTPPMDFLGVLRDMCDEYGIMLIFDEVQSGAGRSGLWWAHEHWSNVSPDLMIFAKGIASGYPLAGLVTRPEFMANVAPNALGGTYGGNAVATAAAVATIEVIEEEGLLNNTRDRGQQLTQGLVKLAEELPIVDVRGRGLMIGVELRNDVPKGTAAAIAKECVERDLLVLTAGTGEVLRFLPALNVTRNEIDDAIAIFKDALAHVCSSHTSQASSEETLTVTLNGASNGSMDRRIKRVQTASRSLHTEPRAEK